MLVEYSYTFSLSFLFSPLYVGATLTISSVFTVHINIYRNSHMHSGFISMVRQINKEKKNTNEMKKVASLYVCELLRSIAAHI